MRLRKSPTYGKARLSVWLLRLRRSVGYSMRRERQGNMSDLPNRLRAISGEALLAPHIKGAVAEAATELDRLGLIVGKAAAYTDSEWAAQLVARDALAAARGYWERHLQETGGR